MTKYWKLAVGATRPPFHFQTINRCNGRESPLGVDSGIFSLQLVVVVHEEHVHQHYGQEDDQKQHLHKFSQLVPDLVKYKFTDGQGRHLGPRGVVVVVVVRLVPLRQETVYGHVVLLLEIPQPKGQLGGFVERLGLRNRSQNWLSFVTGV